MPNNALSEALAEAYASAPTQEVILHTLELNHPSFVTPLRVVNDHQDLMAYTLARKDLLLESGGYMLLESGNVMMLESNTAELVTFVAFSFRFKLPDVTKTGVPEIEIEIDNVSRDVLTYIDLAANSADKIEVTYRPYLASDLSGPQMDPAITLTLHDVEVDIFAIRGRASYGDYGNRRFPGEWYDAQRFPGLIA